MTLDRAKALLRAAEGSRLYAYIVLSLPTGRRPRAAVGAGLPSGDDRHLRWTFQFAAGQGYRLPPRQRHQLHAAIHVRCGTDSAPIDLLRYATDDPVAVLMLRDAEAD